MTLPQWPRAVRNAVRRPLSEILGTQAATMIGKSEPHVRGHVTRRRLVLAMCAEMRGEA